MHNLMLSGKQSASIFKVFLLTLTLLLSTLFVFPMPAQAQATIMATCESWYWTGQCCCGSTRCTKERARQCTANNGNKYREVQCSFWSVC